MRTPRAAIFLGTLGAVAIAAALGVRCASASSQQDAPGLWLFFAFVGAFALALAVVWTISVLVAVALVAFVATTDESAQAYRDAHEGARRGLFSWIRKHMQRRTNASKAAHASTKARNRARCSRSVT